MAKQKKKGWSATITPLLRKYRAENKKIQMDFRAEARKKGIKTINDENKLWRSKYLKRYDAMDKRHDKEYSMIWKKFHSK